MTELAIYALGFAAFVTALWRLAYRWSRTWGLG